VEEKRKLNWRSLSQIEPLQISFLVFEKLVQQRFTGLSPLPWLHRVLSVKHRTLQENYAANDYVSPRESGCRIHLDLEIITHWITLLTLH